MARVFSNNVLEIAVIQTVANRPAVNVWHMYGTEELTGEVGEAIVRDFANNWQDHVVEIQANSVNLIRFEWRSLDPGQGDLGVLAPDPAKSVVGQQVALSAPPNLAFHVKKNTTNRQRGQRDGRMFLAGVPEADVDNSGTLLPGSHAVWQSDINDFYNGISDTATVFGGWAGDRYPVVLETTPASRAPGTQSVTVNSRRVTSLTLDTLCATQRDRMR